MKNLFSPFLFLLVSNFAFGQIEWVGNHSFSETASDLVRTSQGQYILVHNGLTVFDGNGNIVFEGLTNEYPNSDGGRFSEIVELSDTSIVLGMEFFECDVIISAVVKYDKNWNQISFDYAMPVADLAARFSDNSLLFAEGSSLMKMGENGSSSWDQYLQGITITDLVITPEDTIILATNLGLLKMNLDGDVVGNTPNLICSKIELLPNGNLLVETGVMLQLLSPDFQLLTFYQQQGESFKDISIHANGIAVLTSANKVIRFDMGLNPIGTSQLGGHNQTYEAIVSTENGIFAAGSEKFGSPAHGNTSAFIKEFGFDGTAFNTNMDVALTSLSHGSSIDVGHNWGLFAVKIQDIIVTVKNNGPTAVDRLNVNLSFPDLNIWMWECMAVQVFSKPFENLNLQPGASTQLVWGEQTVLFSENPAGSPLNLCFWTSLPNHHLETNNDNDVSCTSVLVAAREQHNIELQAAFNPVTDAVYLHFPPDVDPEKMTLSVFNTAGQLVFSEKLVTGTPLDFSQLTDGMYLLRGSFGERTGWAKVVKY